MNYLIALIVGALALVGSWFINPPNSNYDGLKPEERIIVGATNFPSSLDALTNPSGTDSVSTVSHSGQHSNANDSIEAIESKIGTGASTPVSGTVFVGDGSGTSRWSTFATTTSIYSTNILATGSTTLSDFTFLNATGTAATTTSLAITGVASTSQFYGGHLTACTGSNFLNWTGGDFSCGASSNTITSFSTTTSVAMATATIPTALIPSTDHLFVTITASTTEPATPRILFNSDTTANYTRRTTSSAAATDAKTDNFLRDLLATNQSVANVIIVQLDINNFNNRYKNGMFTTYEYGTSTPTSALTTFGGFFWKNGTGRITQIDIGNSAYNGTTGLWGVGTTIDIVGY